MKILKTVSTLPALALLTVLFLLSGCSRPKGGVCATCPLWFVDPICLTGGDAPDPLTPREKTPPPTEIDLIPGQGESTYKKPQ